MRSLVTALFDVMPRLGSITILLCLIFYIFAALFGGLELDPDSDAYGAFATLDMSVMTLFVFMTMEWADVTRALYAEVWWAWAPAIVFVGITGFIVFNLIIAVVCDAVAVVENKEVFDMEKFEAQGAFGGGDAGTADPGGDGGDDASPPPPPFAEGVEQLHERIETALRIQQRMAATLEALARESLLGMGRGGDADSVAGRAPAQAGAARGGRSGGPRTQLS